MQQVLHFPKLLGLEVIFWAENLWHWWVGEISSLLPARFSLRNILTAEMSGDRFIFVREGINGQTIASEREARGAVNLRLDGQAVFRRTLNMPLSARFKIRNILAHDLERQSPLHPDEVLFTYRIVSVDRHAARLIVSLVLVRRDVVEACVARLNAMELQVRYIYAGDLQGEQEDRLTAPRTSPLPMRKRHRMVVIFLVLAAGFAAAGVYEQNARHNAVIAGLNSEMAQYSTAASSIRSLRQQIEDARNQAGFLAEQRSKPSVGVVLAEITRLLSDKTWLYGLTFDGKTLTVQGYSSTASQLAAQFDSSPLFSGAAFRAPMTQGPQPGIEEFDLTMNLAGGLK